MVELKKYAYKSHQGPFLNLNEDRIEVDLQNKLFILLDAFGGSNIGDVAAKKMGNNIKKFYSNFGGDPEATFPFFYSSKYLIEGNALINSLHFAHEEIKQGNRELPMGKRAGAACLVAAMAENIITFAGTGNCAGYLYRRGELIRVCNPDNLELTAGDGHERYLCTAPVSGLGLFEDLHISMREVKVLEGDIFLLLSDGVYARVNDHELEFMLQKVETFSQESISDIFSLSNSRGNSDNQSALLLQF